MKTIWVGILSLAASGLAQAAPVSQDDMIAAHNRWRAEVGVGPVTWSAAMQNRAEKWANELKTRGCGMKHSGPGENLYWASPQKSATSKDANGNWIWKNSLQAVDAAKVVDSWGSEKSWYDYASNRCHAPAGKSCGHYTQVVWKNSTEIGCAKAVCNDYSQVWVCNYAPAGNMIGSKPY